MDSLPLRDIHLPAGVSAWPLAPGWWVLMLVVALLMFAVWFLWRRGGTQRYSLAQLRGIERQFAEDGDPRRLVTDISTLLRRVCLTYRPRDSVASLTGKAWRDALVSLSGPRGTLPDSVAWQIVHGPYNPVEPIDPKALLGHTRRWLRALPPKKAAA
ncbi:MAG: DUF4381 domain-containing protein [Gammaproteobacteria bacterium]